MPYDSLGSVIKLIIVFIYVEQAIATRMEEVCSMWDTLKERTNSRLEALDRAREIHAFNRNVEETRAWIQEKEAALMFSDDGARDLSSVQALQRKHQGFQVSDYEDSAGDALWHCRYFSKKLFLVLFTPERINLLSLWPTE